MVFNHVHLNHMQISWKLRDFVDDRHISYFSAAVIEHHDKNNLGSNSFLLAPEEQSSPWQGNRGEGKDGENPCALDMGMHTCNLSASKDGQEDCYEFKTSLDYRDSHNFKD